MRLEALAIGQINRGGADVVNGDAVVSADTERLTGYRQRGNVQGDRGGGFASALGSLDGAATAW